MTVLGAQRDADPLPEGLRALARVDGDVVDLPVEDADELALRLAPLRMRAVAAAVLLFVTNIIGLGFGPQAVGILSDLLKPTFGIDSLRYALFAVSSLYLWSGLHYMLAARTLREDLARVQN